MEIATTKLTQPRGKSQLKYVLDAIFNITILLLTY